MHPLPLELPILLAAAPVVGCLLGWVLDRRFGTFPWLTLTLLVVGFISAARELWTAVKRSETGDHRTTPRKP